MIRTIIVDDEAPARDELRFVLAQNHGDIIKIVGEADTTQKAITLITKEQPDLIFLDIQMRGLTGLELAEVIKDISPKSKIIFATAYDEYALKAFELQALDYIVKPIEDDRLALAIKHAMTSVAQQRHQETLINSDTKQTSTLSPASNREEKTTNHFTGDPHKIAVEHEGRILLINISEICYISGDSGHVEIHTQKGIYNSNKTLTELQERLQGAALYRVHRSYIVNLNEVREVIPWFKGTYWLRVNDHSTKGPILTDVPISKAQVKNVRELLGIS